MQWSVDEYDVPKLSCIDIIYGNNSEPLMRQYSGYVCSQE
jgi:hypothetical protein